MARGPVYNSFNNIREFINRASLLRKHTYYTMGGRGSGRRIRSGTPRKTRSTNTELLTQLKLMEAEAKKSTKVTPTKDKSKEIDPRVEAKSRSDCLHSWFDKKHRSDDDSQSDSTTREQGSNSTTNTNKDDDSASDYSLKSGSSASMTEPRPTKKSIVAQAKLKTKTGNSSIVDFITLPSSSNPTKPPQMRQINRPETMTSDYPEKSYKLHIKMRKQLQKSGQVINIVDHFKILLSRMIFEVPNLLLIPFDGESKENHIAQGCDVPTEEDKFTTYVKGARITKADSLLLNFKVLFPIPFGQLKNKPTMFKFLNEKRYFIQLQQLSTYENIKVGGFIYVHNQYVRRDDIVEEISSRLNMGYDEEIKIQLVPYIFTIGEGEEKVVTRTMAIETSITDADKAKARLYKTFAQVTSEWKHSNSSHFKFFLFRATADIPERAIQEFAKAQNNFLHSILEIPLYNLDNIDWVIPSKDITFRELLMSAKHPNTGESLCYSIERTSAADKYFIIVKQAHREYVKEWLSKIADGLENLNTFDWMSHTGKDTRFRFTFMEQNESHRQYTRNLLQQINPNYDNPQESSMTVTPPPFKKRVRTKIIAYGKPPEPAWKGANDTIHTITGSSKGKGSSTATPTNVTQHQPRQSKSSADTTSNELEARLLERIKKMNTTVDETIAEIRTTSNNTKFLVEKMLDTHDKLLKENRERDQRMNSIQEGMMSNHRQLQSIKNNATKNVQKITKILTAMYNKISPDAQITIDDWEGEEEATLDDIISLQGNITRQEKKRKTLKDKDATEKMVVDELNTQPTPAKENGMRGVALP